MSVQKKSVHGVQKKSNFKGKDISNLSENVMSSVGVGIYIVQQGKFVYVSPLYQKYSGYSDTDLIGQNSLNHLHPADKQMTRDKAVKVLKGGSSEPYEYRFFRKDGRMIWVLEMVTSIIYKGERGTLGSFMDITERKQMEDKVRQSEERYRTIIEEMDEWYFETDLNGRILFFNDNFINGFENFREKLAGMNFRTVIRNENADKLFNIFHQVYETGEAIKNYPYEFFRPDGSTTFAEFSIFPKRNQDGKISGFRGVAHDITSRRQAEDRIQHLATHDSLTNLPNRVLLNQMLGHFIQSARRYNRQFAVFFIDLDRFKFINDTLGHEVGDQLLREIAERFRQEIRASDIVARLGGDEFVVLIDQANDRGDIATIARKILAAVIKPFIVAEQEWRITASIGICLYPDDADAEQSLIKCADLAMYFAKEEGKNNFQFYSKDIHSKSIERLSIERNLRHAMDRNELFLHYQARRNTKTGITTGVEALLRWENPNLGSVTPSQFIPVAEETGLIIPIGRWVLKTACAQNVAWQCQGLSPVCISVNLSQRQLRDENLLTDIKTALNESGMAPHLLELELTESMMMQDTMRTIKVLSKIKKMGIRLAIDDFGTGYSSLAQLKRFPIDTLKVDRSFIRDISNNADDKAIIKAIIAMGKTLSLTVCAEGVETPAQEKFLRKYACDEMQGFSFSKPVPPDKFANILRQQNAYPVNPKFLSLNAG